MNIEMKAFDKRKRKKESVIRFFLSSNQISYLKINMFNIVASKISPKFEEENKNLISIKENQRHSEER